MDMGETVNEISDDRAESFCEIAGCTGAVTNARWVTIGPGEERPVEVCWKHAKDDIEPSLLSNLRPDV